RGMRLSSRMIVPVTLRPTPGRDAARPTPGHAPSSARIANSIRTADFLTLLPGRCDRCNRCETYRVRRNNLNAHVAVDAGQRLNDTLRLSLRAAGIQCARRPSRDQGSHMDLTTLSILLAVLVATLGLDT